MSEWDSVLKQVYAATKKSSLLFYRGHSAATWKLIPSLGRLNKYGGFNNLHQLEQAIYFDFVTRSGSLLPSNNDCWNNVFSMQHHGVPTRLLDWTETFSVALYFALKTAKTECAIWILDPFLLNEVAFNTDMLLNPHELPVTYSKCFLEKSDNLSGEVVAISPLRHNPRVFSQTSGFTLHGNLTQPLEDLFPACLTKIVIPKRAFNDAYKFLQLSGINEFTLFPDLDGLVRDIKSNYSL